MFAAEIETSRRADGLSWQPGQLLGDLEARAPISHSPTFLPPGESSQDFQSATSRGHLPKFPRPAGVGAGWGDHDLFREWQIHGRQVKRSMVEDKEWSEVPARTLEFVPTDDSPAGTRGVTIPLDAGFMATDNPLGEPPKSLFEMLNPEQEASQKGGRQKGRRPGGNRGRGG